MLYPQHAGGSDGCDRFTHGLPHDRPVLDVEIRPEGETHGGGRGADAVKHDFLVEPQQGPVGAEIEQGDFNGDPATLRRYVHLTGKSAR